MSRIPEHSLQAIRVRLPLSGLIGRAVRLQRRGADHVGLCPFHDERTPSFTVQDSRGFYHCFGCGAHGDVFAWLQQMQGLDFRVAVLEAARLAGVDIPGFSAGADGAPPADPLRHRQQVEEAARAAAERRHQRDEDEARIRAYALDIWRVSVLIEGTPAEAYLRGRGITLDRWPVSLRFHPDLPCRQYRKGVKEPVLAGRFPALVGAVQAPDGHIGGIWRVYLARDAGASLTDETPCRPPTHGVSPDVRWRKAGPREGVTDAKLGLGSVVGGAVRLADWRGAHGSGDLLAIAEGIETALSALACGVPSWAALAASRMKRLVLPDGLRRVLLIADHDGTGLQAMLARVAEWQREGREVQIILPVRAGDDLNDVIRVQATEMQGVSCRRAK